ncbi:MAG: hypothetical protein P0Y56_08905 [Candidatus Andeanibacterium colombiense]|uniref:Lipoprotein n=1 Tax=Candidatus Andeanibacterium colombiense TaxID=3121345 RepID=A0AAJ5X5Y8_9SPHN|nr:MAG: hypothetical protein P0Y56_08905 [Sphingomonadaceae bacterium]
MGAIRGALILAAALLIAGCGDDAPNKDFAQQMKDRDAANAGDRYASLESSMPTQQRYGYQKEELRQDYADGQSGTFRATYDGLLEKLDSDKDADPQSSLFKSCRATFGEVSAWQKSSGGDAAASAPAREKLLAQLHSCRDQAKKGGEKAAALARFASTGIVMIGAKVVGQGDRDAGLKIWREGEDFARQDKPGFELGLKSFQGY